MTLEKKEILYYPYKEFKVDNKVSESFKCSCSLLEEASSKGHLCLTNNCIGFLKDNEEKIFQINFNDIYKLALKGKNIEIETKNENKIILNSFDKLKEAFDKINSAYKIFNENKEEKNYMSCSDSDSYFDNEENKTSLSSKISSVSLSSSKDSSSKNIFSLKEDDSVKSLKETQSTTDIKKIKLKKDDEEEKKSFIRNNSSKDFTINKKIDFLDSNFKEKPQIPEKIIFKKIDPELDYEICKKIINLSPKDLFDKYQTNKNRETSYQAYYEWAGQYSEIEIQNWEKIKNEETEFTKYQRKEKFCITLHGVLLINKSNVEKVSTYWIDKEGAYYMHTISKSKGVPLSDKFTVETMAEFHPFMNNTKTVFRTYVRTNIIKWNLFKLALVSQGKKSYTQEIEKWLKFIEEKGDIVEGNYII